jgi:hypothetical protein
MKTIKLVVVIRKLPKHKPATSAVILLNEDWAAELDLSDSSVRAELDSLADQHIEEFKNTFPEFNAAEFFRSYHQF